MITLTIILIVELAIGWIIADTQQQLAKSKRYRLVERCMTAPTRRNFSEVEDERKEVQSCGRCTNNKGNTSKKHKRGNKTSKDITFND